MPKYKDEVQTFRHRGFLPDNGGPVVMVFGDGPEPTAPGVVYTKQWDHDVSEAIQVSDHVEPGPALPAPVVLDNPFSGGEPVSLDPDPLPPAA